MCSRSTVDPLGRNVELELVCMNMIINKNRKIMKRIIIAAIIALMALQVPAVEVENSAGDLSQRVTDLNASTLVVTGTMDARDFYFIVDNMKKLTSIDLTNVQVSVAAISASRFMSLVTCVVCSTSFVAAIVAALFTILSPSCSE